MEMYIDLSNVSEQDFARFQGFRRGIYWRATGDLYVAREMI